MPIHHLLLNLNRSRFSWSVLATGFCAVAVCFRLGICRGGLEGLFEVGEDVVDVFGSD